VTKATQLIIKRGISSSANSGRPSGLLNSEARESIYLPRKLSDLKTECSKRSLKTGGSKADLVRRLSAYDEISKNARSHSTFGTSVHRPLPIPKTIPLMQGFRTSAPVQASHDSSTMDFFFFPEIPPAAPSNPFAQLRVPLLPDNMYPNRDAGSVHAREVEEEGGEKQEIMVMASHPEDVLPVAMGEVVAAGDGGDGGVGGVWTEGFEGKNEEEKTTSVFRELWSGLVDDVLGPKTPRHAL